MLEEIHKQQGDTNKAIKGHIGGVDLKQNRAVRMAKDKEEEQKNLKEREDEARISINNNLDKIVVELEKLEKHAYKVRGEATRIRFRDTPT